MDALFFYCKNSERRWLTVPARKTAWFCTRSADRRIALSCPSPVPQHPKFIRFPSLRSALLHFRTKFQFFCRKDLHCPAFSAIIHVVADADVAQSVERILGKDEVTSSNLVSSSKKHLKSSDFGCFSLQKCTFRCGSKCGSTAWPTPWPTQRNA